MNIDFLSGFEVHSSSHVVEQEKIPVVKNGGKKVLDWNPCNTELQTPDFIAREVPSTKIYFLGNKMICHPDYQKSS